LEGHPVVGPQSFQAIRQAADEPTPAPAHVVDVEQLLLHGKVALRRVR
jgi:hypothetical protein